MTNKRLILIIATMAIIMIMFTGCGKTTTSNTNNSKVEDSTFYYNGTNIDDKLEINADGVLIGSSYNSSTTAS